MNEANLRNMGLADATLRILAVPFVLVGMGWVAVWDWNWALTALIGGMLTVWYLIVTAVVKIDPIYVATGFSTIHRMHLEHRHHPKIPGVARRHH